MEFNNKLNKIISESGRTPTQHQMGIYQWVYFGSGNAIVNAVAGSGKSTTLIDSLNFINSNDTVILVAFNKHIAEELNGKDLPSNAKAQTLHSLGFGALRKGVSGRVRVDGWKVKKKFKEIMDYNYLNSDEKKEFWNICNPLSKAVSLLKNFGYGLNDSPIDLDNFKLLVDRYNVELPDIDFNNFSEYCFQCLSLSNKDHKTIDFDDMLYLPLHLGLSIPKFDFVFVDESQDLNAIQIEMVRRMSSGGRAIFVGDRHQAIYGFRGADTSAMDTVGDLFDAEELPLSICWRCSSSVISSAQQIVPHIEASPSACEGSVRSLREDMFLNVLEDNDYVLCRTTAPLVSYCFKLIRNGRKGVISGRDIGENLKNVLDKIKRSNHSGSILEQIESWGSEELKKLSGPYDVSRRSQLEDQIDCLVVLSEDCCEWSDISSAIDHIFSDDISGVLFATIHRSKGLESDRVFVLKPELLPHPNATQSWELEQESNLEYVAITRAKRELIWVESVDEKKK